MLLVRALIALMLLFLASGPSAALPLTGELLMSHTMNLGSPFGDPALRADLVPRVPIPRPLATISVPRVTVTLSL